MRKATFVAAALVLARQQFTSAQTSLYLPDFDPQPVTANQLGVNADGQTTWLIAPGSSSNGLDGHGIYGPATLVEGPSDAHLIYIDTNYGISLQEDCIISAGVAACTAVVGDLLAAVPPETDFLTETASPMEVQGGGATPIATVTRESSGSSQALSGPDIASGPAITAAPAPASSDSGKADSSQGAPTSGPSAADVSNPAASATSASDSPSAAGASSPSNATSPPPSSSQSANAAVGIKRAPISLFSAVGIAVLYFCL
ncbi:hypothetical protein CERSUDRAFT_113290 [Gelatoporia subvermispora B]|uniref:Uncharacterized protein n=1 Tax=Ceriporiopsis subvermispora (strain B) TaxID=914234 RepID=M2R0V1_CERS8|nr:hypothetical protein CERSUDRAFT_113290 [Gelatoporia subvermispora B]